MLGSFEFLSVFDVGFSFVKVFCLLGFCWLVWFFLQCNFEHVCIWDLMMLNSESHDLKVIVNFSSSCLGCSCQQKF